MSNDNIPKRTALFMAPDTCILELVEIDPVTGAPNTLSAFNLAPLRLTPNMPRAFVQEGGSYEIWMAGTIVDGHLPQFLGQATGANFGEACDNICGRRAHYSPENLLLRGRGLFNSEERAKIKRAWADEYPPDDHHTLQPDDLKLGTSSTEMEIK